ncbi:spaetzle domain-containing protein [Trichonephila clavata]|uniref:Spaetzle domain-containing protein n=1 Tax=Trichonephila clavata TaxID=2740835 RepID=A0A8X6LDN2_TRICU|nr:spaetzle domain-containing protein [Trichonephila clavata]
MIRLAIVCCLGVVGGVPLFRDETFTPSPPGSRPPCAMNSATFCEKVDKYPTKTIQKILQSKAFLLDDLFTDEREGLQEPPEFILHEELLVPENETESRNRKIRSVTDKSSSNQSAPELSKRCPILSKAALPKLAASSGGEWRFIVQDELSDTNQKIKVHICDKSEECSIYCTQFYSPVNMVFLSNNGSVAKDTFWMPSSCRCQSSPINTL